MSFLKSVEAARARVRENATPCDNRDIATPDANPTTEPVAASQLSQQGPPAGEDDLWRWRYLFEERSAIREYDGVMSRAEAEAGALDDLSRQWRSENPLPASDRSTCCHCGKPAPCTPVLAANGHAWLHEQCWAPMNDTRQREALDAVKLMLNASTKDA